MKLKEIKDAVDAGKTVHWETEDYTVIHDMANGCNRWLIAYRRGSPAAHYVGLTEAYSGFFIGAEK